MKGKAHSDETKASAIAALLEGQGVCEVAKKYKLPESSVRNFKKKIDREQLAQVSAKKEENLTSLIEGHLTASLTAATQLAENTKDESWFAEQNAADIGVLYGILSDKAIRILEAIERSEGETEN